MNNTENKKKHYCFPSIEKIIADNEISLALESDPPIPEGESDNTLHMPNIDQPFRT